MSLVGSMLRSILSAAIISFCLLSCFAVSGENEAPLSVAKLSDHFLDDAFDASLSAIDAPEFFLELPEAYKSELDKIMAPLEIEFDRYSALRAWTFEQIEDYQFEIIETYSLGELNTNRRINCLSFSVMFVAAARHVNVPAEFQLVYAPPYWDIDNKTWINNQHIDVTGIVKRKSSDTDPFLKSKHSLASGLPYINSTFVRFNSSRYVVDLNPAIVSMPLKRERLDDRQILSLYFNNKGMASLLAGDRGMAYAYTKKALLTDSGSAPAWNNLGVLFLRLGELEYAANAFLKAIEMELLVARFRDYNPYYHQFLAAQSLNDGNYEQAIEHLEHAVARKHNELAFYHELALAHQKLGHGDKAVQNLRKARRHAKGIQKQRFSGKLEALQALVETP